MANLSKVKLDYFILSVPNDEKLYTISKSNVMTRWNTIAASYLKKEYDVSTIKMPIDVLQQMGCFQVNYNILNPVKKELNTSLRLSLNNSDINYDSILDELYKISIKGMFFDFNVLQEGSSQFNSALELAKNITSFGHLPAYNILSFTDSNIEILPIQLEEITKYVLYIKFN